MSINILAGGPEQYLPDLSNFCDDQSLWVGVDRGVFKLITLGIKPKVAFGDFDSVTANELAIIEKSVATIQKFKPEKDETDLELALDWAMSFKPKKIRIFGATGGRLDHLLANIHLLLKANALDDTVSVKIIDKQNIAYIKKPGTHTIHQLAAYKYVSFIPLTMHVDNLTLTNFKYPLKNRHIPIGSTLCISNELINKQGTFSFSTGILLVIRSSD